MKSKVLLLGGTTEGSALALALAERGASVVLQVATPYGAAAAPDHPHITLRAGRLEAEGMAALLREGAFRVAVDATHPYAAQVTANLQAACRAVKTPYLRVLRQAGEAAEDILCADSTQQAVELLAGMEGKILLTTGSKELSAYTAIPNWQERLYPRVLPSPQVVADCAALGVPGANLICMQGPFSHELNAAMLRATGASILVTKDSGEAGGFGEKLSAARACGAKVVLIRRPVEEQGHSPQDALHLLAELLALPEQPTQKRDIPPFPLFVRLSGKPVLVVGGGGIAARRVRALLDFGAAVTVVSPGLSPELEPLRDRLDWRRERYCGIAKRFALVLAATNDRAVNARVGQDARSLDIPVSVADSREESTFWFPALLREGDFVGGLVSATGDHSGVRKAAALLRDTLRANYNGKREKTTP